MLCVLNLAHGSFIGNVRIEAHKPTQLPVDSTIKFGASTRLYTLREKPNSELALEEDTSGNLPDTEYELDVNRT